MEAARFTPDTTCFGGDLDCGNGLLTLIRSALERIEVGQVLEVLSTEPTVWHDLPAWCRVNAHPLLGAVPDGERTRYYLQKGAVSRGEARPDWGMQLPLRNGKELDTADWFVGRVGEVPAHAATADGFAPRGSVLEPGAPDYDFFINDRDEVWAENVAELYEQATAGQWDASRDIPWDRLEPLPEPMERAVCQIMTFLTENEFSALYVPGKFVSRINPRYQEVVMFLCTHMMDEARHIEVFTKRALANGGGLQYSAASSQLSLKSLFDQQDFSSASFLLSVLGEGTFVDLLRFIQDHAPDPVTAEIVWRARVDETRHVHFGLSHARHYLQADSSHVHKLTAAVRARAAYMESVTDINPMVQEALAILAGGGIEPDQVQQGLERVRLLMQTMHENRIKRLVTAGFTPDQARELSELHTPNFM